MKRFVRFRNCLLVMILSSLCGGAASFAAEQAAEHAVRAALLVNFMKFSEWPAGAFPDEKLRVCVASGDVDQKLALQSIEGRQVRRVRIEVLAYQAGADCDLLYVDSRQRWKAIHEQLRGRHVLTVGGYDGFLEDAGMIEIALLPAGPRFDVSLTESRRAGVRFNPQFLRLARRVVD